MQRRSASARAGLAVALFFMVAPGLTAQDAEADNGKAAGEFVVTTEVLERLVSVYPLVVAIADDAKPRIADAETDAVARAIEELAKNRIEAVLEGADLTPAQYMATVRVLNADEELRAEFQRMLYAYWNGAPGDA
jgi:hypothetical protein